MLLLDYFTYVFAIAETKYYVYWDRRGEKKRSKECISSNTLHLTRAITNNATRVQ